MHQLHLRRSAAMLLFALAAATSWFAPTGAMAAAAQDDATPATDPCASAEAAPDDGMVGMDMGTAMAGMDMQMEFDQLYIDMMIPHHASIIAMSEAALTRLEDERLRAIAQRIIDTQSAEQEELRGYREQFYGDPEPMAMDDQMMGMMSQMMPGMGSMDEMAMQMDPNAQVAAICGAEDADLAFIEMTIAHHEMAVTASEAALEQATHDEIRAFAERVIEDQQREIDEVTEIREDLSSTGTLSASGA